MDEQFTLAITLERMQDDSWRAIMFEIGHEIGAASVIKIVQDDTPEGAVSFLCEEYKNKPIAVKVYASDHQDDAVPIGNHLVVWPDALTLVETAVALSHP